MLGCLQKGRGMKKSYLEAAAFIAIAAGLFISGFVIANLIKEPPIKSGDWPSWVQAVGSIAAIGVAIWVSHHQHEKGRALEIERKRLDDIRRVRAVKAVLVQICTLAEALYKAIETNDAEELYDFDPQFLVDYKTVLQSLPLFDVPSTQIVLYLNTVPRAIDEVTVRLFEARKQENEPVFRYEWLLASDIEHRVKNLYNLATTANNYCFDEIESMGGWTAEEQGASAQK
jgi:hypothetical protein